MLIKATYAHVRFMLRRKNAKLTFFLLFALMLLNYVNNVLSFRGSDIIAMYHPMKILTLSYNRVYYNADMALLIVQLFPLIVNLPAGLSLAFDKDAGVDTLLISRLGSYTYTFSKIIATAITTTIVFTVPFLLEIILNCIAFPLNSTGDLSNNNIFEFELTTMINNYLFSELYLFSPYLYAIVGTLLFGLVAGLLAGFTASISTVICVKYRVLLLLPVFLFLHATASFEAQEYRWYTYLLLFNDEPKNLMFAACVIILLVVLCLICCVMNSKKRIA